MINTDKNHQHTYDAQGRITCCSLEEKIYNNAGAKNLILPPQKHNHNHSKGDNHNHGSPRLLLFISLLSFILLFSAILLDYLFKPQWFFGWWRITWYILAYLPVGIPVIKEAFESILKKEVFSEFFLMTIATLGAFAIGEYPEAVAVMLFYTVGEAFQTLAIKRSKTNVKALLDQRPDEVTVIKNNQPKTVKAKDVLIGEIIQLKPGEKLGLDGELLSETASFNTSALTGESKPDTKSKGETVLAGMINLNTSVQVKVTTNYLDSKLSKILELVQDATSHKSPTELFIRKFAKIYTPIVVFLAIVICLLPYFFISNFQFSEWLYRSLIFLVISCPCALVISIPLGYFGGIGAASKNGVLVKGSNFLDLLASIQHVVMDKTGTLTEGIFEVRDVVIDKVYNHKEILDLINLLESHSSHPIATAIEKFVGPRDYSIPLKNVEEIAGLGLKAEVYEKTILVGNFRLMDMFSIPYNFASSSIVDTVIAIALDGNSLATSPLQTRLKKMQNVQLMN